MLHVYSMEESSTKEQLFAKAAGGKGAIGKEKPVTRVAYTIRVYYVLYSI